MGTSCVNRPCKSLTVQRPSKNNSKEQVQPIIEQQQEPITVRRQPIQEQEGVRVAPQEEEVSYLDLLKRESALTSPQKIPTNANSSEYSEISEERLLIKSNLIWNATLHKHKHLIRKEILCKDNSYLELIMRKMRVGSVSHTNNQFVLLSCNRNFKFRAVLIISILGQVGFDDRQKF
tara:strand:- start:796 stop:1326 length:531 start_codon:yes stop_codon:yes gene_type:complete